MIRLKIYDDSVEATGSVDFENWAVEEFHKLRGIFAQRERASIQRKLEQDKLAEIQAIDQEIFRLKHKRKNLITVQP